MADIEGVRLPFIPAGGVEQLKSKPVPFQPKGNQAVSFKDVFEKELEGLKFSRHAQSRLISREIHLSPMEVDRLENALVKAREKGSNDSLILLDEKAFIVNVPNKTVITVVGKDNMQDNVITNIDTAVFA